MVFAFIIQRLVQTMYFPIDGKYHTHAHALYRKQRRIPWNLQWIKITHLNNSCAYSNGMDDANIIFDPHKYEESANTTQLPPLTRRNNRALLSNCNWYVKIRVRHSDGNFRRLSTTMNYEFHSIHWQLKLNGCADVCRLIAIGQSQRPTAEILDRVRTRAQQIQRIYRIWCGSRSTLPGGLALDSHTFILWMILILCSLAICWHDQ